MYSILTITIWISWQPTEEYYRQFTFFTVNIAHVFKLCVYLRQWRVMNWMIAGIRGPVLAVCDSSRVTSAFLSGRNCMKEQHPSHCVYIHTCVAIWHHSLHFCLSHVNVLEQCAHTNTLTARPQRRQLWWIDLCLLNKRSNKGHFHCHFHSCMNLCL